MTTPEQEQPERLTCELLRTPNSGSPIYDLTPLVEAIVEIVNPTKENQPTNLCDALANCKLNITTKDNTSITFRLLQQDDFDKGYMQLLSQLTKVGEVNKTEFVAQFNTIFNNTGVPNTFIIIAETEISEDPIVKTSTRIVGTATLLLEKKFIRQLGTVGHLEDVVVLEPYRHHGIGLMLVQAMTALSESLGAYKTILDCTADKQHFYTQAGYSSHAVQMSKYK